MAWFRSRDGAILLSAVAFLAFIERAFLDWRFVFAEFVPDTDIATTALAMGFYVAVSGTWLWALAAAARGGRGGIVALLVLSLLLLVGLGIGTLVSFCPSVCQTAWPLGELSNWAGLVIGLLAAAATGLQLRGP